MRTSLEIIAGGSLDEPEDFVAAVPARFAAQGAADCGAGATAISFEDWDRVIETDLKGALITCRAASFLRC